MNKETVMKILKELYNNSLSAERTALETIIPELEESEDERIRKKLRKLLSNLFNNYSYFIKDPFYTECIAWIEKQYDDVKKIKELENKIESLQKCFKIANDEIADKSQELYALKCKIEEEGYQWDEENLELKKIKQKPVEEYNITGIKSRNAQGKLGEMIKNLKPVKEVLEQDSIDKVELKFKVGDWIFHERSGNIFHINRIDNRTYISDEGATISFGRQNDWRLWTIQDAKDGDVLCSNQIILLFKQWKDNSDCNFVIAYAGIDVSGKLQITNGHWLIDNESKPATRNQRDLLFRKIKEAGYEWDSEKKELKKISQEYPLIPDECIKSTWSEEDEKKRKGLIKGLEDRMGFGWASDPFSREEYIDWLKSLKDRYTWKPTEKQLISLSCAIAALDAEDDDLASLYEILKKL